MVKILILLHLCRMYTNIRFVQGLRVKPKSNAERRMPLACREGIGRRVCRQWHAVRERGQVNS